jgi:hypothetical protein
MADLKLLDKVFDLITQHFIVTGQAPHYTELAFFLVCGKFQRSASE